MFNVSKLHKLPSLMILQNRSSHLECVSSEVCFDFFKPSQRISKETGTQPNNDSSNGNLFEGESNHFTDTKLWSHIVRTVSYLFITSRYILDSIYFVLEFTCFFLSYF